MVLELNYTAFALSFVALVAADFTRDMTETTKEAIDALDDNFWRVMSAFWEGDGHFDNLYRCYIMQSLRNAPAMLAWWTAVGGMLYIYREATDSSQLMICWVACSAAHMRWIGEAMRSAGHLTIKKHEVELMLRSPQGTPAEWIAAHAKVRRPPSLIAHPHGLTRRVGIADEQSERLAVVWEGCGAHSLSGVALFATTPLPSARTA
jgi:hypothetical protein